MSSPLLPATRILATRRALYSPSISRTILRRHMHADGHNPVPFTVNKNRRLFALKYLAYMGTGFSIPFIAIWWHWNRPGGLNNS